MGHKLCQTPRGRSIDTWLILHPLSHGFGPGDLGKSAPTSGWPPQPSVSWLWLFQRLWTPLLHLYLFFPRPATSFLCSVVGFLLSVVLMCC